MKLINRFLILVLPLALHVNFAKAQELLTLEQILEIAYQNSPSIVQSKLSLTNSRESLNAQKAALKSRFSLDISPFTYSNKREFNNLISDYFTSKSKGSSSTFSIVQPIKATDGTISLRNNLGWQDYSNDYNNVNSNTFSNNVQITLDQPIFTYNRTKMNLKSLELNLENSLISYSMQKLNIERQVTQYFYNLYQAQQSLFISKEEFDNQKKTFEITQNKVDAGIMAEEALWQAELNLANARSDVYNAEVSLEEAKDQLKQIIGMNLNSTLEIIANVNVETIDVDLNKAVEHAIQQRMELRQREIAIEKSQFDIITTKASNEFKGNVSLSVGLFGENESAANIYNEPTNNQQIALTFQIPLWDWGEKKSRIKAAEASLEMTQLNMKDEKIDIEISIRQIYRNLNNLVNQIEIAKKNVENAKLTYELNLEKYANGDLTGMQLNDYQTQLSSSKNSVTFALINYKLELLNLKIQTLWDFEAQESIVPSEYSTEFKNN